MELNDQYAMYNLTEVWTECDRVNGWGDLAKIQQKRVGPNSHPNDQVAECFSLQILFLIGVFVFIEWLGREHQFAIQNLGIKWKRPIRYAMYYAIIIAIFWFGGKEQQFIYFQF